MHSSYTWPDRVFADVAYHFKTSKSQYHLLPEPGSYFGMQLSKLREKFGGQGSTPLIIMRLLESGEDEQQQTGTAILHRLLADVAKRDGKPCPLAYAAKDNASFRQVMLEPRLKCVKALAHRLDALVKGRPSCTAEGDAQAAKSVWQSIRLIALVARDPHAFDASFIGLAAFDASMKYIFASIKPSAGCKLQPSRTSSKVAFVADACATLPTDCLRGLAAAAVASLCGHPLVLWELVTRLASPVGVQGLVQAWEHSSDNPRLKFLLANMLKAASPRPALKADRMPTLAADCAKLVHALHADVADNGLVVACSRAVQFLLCPQLPTPLQQPEGLDLLVLTLHKAVKILLKHSRDAVPSEPCAVKDALAGLMDLVHGGVMHLKRCNAHKQLSTPHALDLMDALADLYFFKLAGINSFDHYSCDSMMVQLGRFLGQAVQDHTCAVERLATPRHLRAASELLSKFCACALVPGGQAASFASQAGQLSVLKFTWALLKSGAGGACVETSPSALTSDRREPVAAFVAHVLQQAVHAMGSQAQEQSMWDCIDLCCDFFGPAAASCHCLDWLEGRQTDVGSASQQPAPAANRHPALSCLKMLAVTADWHVVHGGGPPSLMLLGGAESPDARHTFTERLFKAIGKAVLLLSGCLHRASTVAALRKAGAVKSLQALLESPGMIQRSIPECIRVVEHWLAVLQQVRAHSA
ncbi:hypothetical protein WJX72_006618 [[Myrmecia] bisecta]|uniref:Uncharacterized protein n=1 Tax=[Myrmecia] bisecta TaxID=41462 RepID=A0AAW1Q0L1_9CHLO